MAIGLEGPFYAFLAIFVTIFLIGIVHFSKKRKFTKNSLRISFVIAIAIHLAIIFFTFDAYAIGLGTTYFVINILLFFGFAFLLTVKRMALFYTILLEFMLIISLIFNPLFEPFNSFSFALSLIFIALLILNRSMFTSEKLTIKTYAIVLSIAILSAILGLFLLSSPFSDRFQKIDTIKNKIGGWDFIGANQTQINGIPVYSTYYSKSLPDSRIEESKVDIYVFPNRASAVYGIDNQIGGKDCSWVVVNNTEIEIDECSQNGVWWISKNLMINIGPSDRTPGVFIDAYDLVVRCRLINVCKNGDNQYIAYAPKSVFDAYVEKYPI